MITLTFDTETTGIWRDKEPFDSPDQPHLLQLGCKLSDARKRRVARFSVLIQPDGWSIEPEAQAHHGISEERANRFGIPLVSALAPFRFLCAKADVLVAHNVNFDRAVVHAALLRAGADTLFWQRMANRFRCTMEEATDILQLPGEYDEAKYASLAEAHDFFFPELGPYRTRHDAEEDCDAAERIFWAIEERKANAVAS